METYPVSLGVTILTGNLEAYMGWTVRDFVDFSLSKCPAALNFRV